MFGWWKYVTSFEQRVEQHKANELNLRCDLADSINDHTNAISAAAKRIGELSALKESVKM